MSNTIKIFLGFLFFTIVFGVVFKKQIAQKLKIFEQEITYSNQSYAPYDVKYFYNELKKTAKSFNENKGVFDSTLAVDKAANSKILVITGKYFQPNIYETQKLDLFVKNGGTVLISAFDYNQDFLNYQFQYLNYKLPVEADIDTLKSNNEYEVETIEEDSIMAETDEIESTATFDTATAFIEEAVSTIDSLNNNEETSYLDTVDRAHKNPNYIIYKNNFTPKPNKYRLSVKWQNSNKTYTYPGRKTTSFIHVYPMDSVSHWVNFVDTGYPVLIERPIGSGSLIINNSPLNFSNYFLLYKDNNTYLTQLIDKLNIKNKTIIWDTYYSNITNRNFFNEEKNRGNSFFSQLMENTPALKYAVYSFYVLCVIFFLNFVRKYRKSTAVLPIASNESLALSQLLSGIYWKQNDNLSIAKKLIQQYQQHLQYQYSINSNEINVKNIEYLSTKTGINQGVFNKLFQIEQNLTLVFKNNENNTVNTTISDETLKNIYQLTHQIIYKSKTK